MERGEKFTSMRKMAEQVECTDSTLHKAINQSPELKEWAAKPKADRDALSKSKKVRGIQGKGVGYHLHSAENLAHKMKAC